MAKTKKVNKRVVKVHQYDDIYLTEMHLCKTILKAYGIDMEIVQKKRPMHHQTKYNVTGNNTSAYLVSDLLSSLSHLKMGK